MADQTKTYAKLPGKLKSEQLPKWMDLLVSKFEEIGYETSIELGQEYIIFAQEEYLTIIAQNPKNEQDKIEVMLSDYFIMVSKKDRLRIKKSEECKIPYSTICALVYEAFQDTKKDGLLSKLLPTNK